MRGVLGCCRIGFLLLVMGFICEFCEVGFRIREMGLTGNLVFGIL